MKPPTTPGGYANTAGSTLEHVVMDTLSGKGFRVVPWRDYRKLPAAFGSEVLVRDVPYDSIYGHAGKTEFVLHSGSRGLSIRIECKWQQSPGSVDEKFPYLYLNAVEAMPEPSVFILVDGGGAKPGAVTWLRNAAHNRLYCPPGSTKEIRVMTLADFIGWAHKTLR